MCFKWNALLRFSEKKLKHFLFIPCVLHAYVSRFIYYYRYSAHRPVWAETRAQSGDWYVSGTLHPGQILRGSLPLLSPAFRSSHFRYQVPLRPPRRERSQRRKVELVGENCPVIFCLNVDFHATFRDLLHAANLRHGTDGFTSTPKEGALRIFFALKNPTASAGFELANLGTKGQHATPRPPKPPGDMIWNTK